MSKNVSTAFSVGRKEPESISQAGFYLPEHHHLLESRVYTSAVLHSDSLLDSHSALRMFL